MNTRRSSSIAHVIGFDDAPFPPDYAGPVKVVGAVYARLRLTGVLIGEIEKDGHDAAETLARLVAGSKFAENLHLIMLQGIALGGFNVVDVFALHERLALPILVVARRQPNMEAIRDALLGQVADGAQKWALLARLGPMEPLGDVYVQRLGLTATQAATVLRQFTVEGNIPEPLRTAHLIAGAWINGESRGRT
ncbi:MAG TPA: DUF99 family protein [Anaerolineae bacterium]|nr:DUF99 family protein [Anaerolineae bacterium]HQH38788.1 DUF99 family protein [Anaerolineae bacterium]